MSSLITFLKSIIAKKLDFEAFPYYSNENLNDKDRK